MAKSKGVGKRKIGRPRNPPPVNTTFSALDAEAELLTRCQRHLQDKLTALQAQERQLQASLPPEDGEGSSQPAAQPAAPPTALSGGPGASDGFEWRVAPSGASMLPRSSGLGAYAGDGSDDYDDDELDDDGDDSDDGADARLRQFMQGLPRAARSQFQERLVEQLDDDEAEGAEAAPSWATAAAARGAS